LEIRDLIVTPVVLIIIYAAAYLLKPFITDEVTRQYYFSALTVRILGALALGLIYQFYYGGGDTFNFHTHGSRHIWEAFVDSPEKGFKLLFSHGTNETGVYQYSSKIPFFRDPSSYAIIRIASVLDIFTFSAYSATAVLFSVIGFIGSWLLFITFYRQYPHLHFRIALATLFIPSVVFWGSGIMKDTITLACLGVITYCVKSLWIDLRFNLTKLVVLMLTCYVIFIVKKYILLSFLPAVLLWLYTANLLRIRSLVFRIMLLPIAIMLAVVSGYFAVDAVSASDSRYALDQIGNTAKITAYDIAYQTGRDAGSTYSLGELDGSFASMVRLAPQAINVSLFRPYVWEVRNPLMLMSAMESLTLLMLTFYVVYKSKWSLFKAMSNPDVLFCLVFSITFAFAVGVATFNFGTLSRYKIPLLPFYSLALILMMDYSKRDKNVEVFDVTE
jgi:hypothetical protein